jgi:hypothetical protein
MDRGDWSIFLYEDGIFELSPVSGFGIVLRSRVDVCFNDNGLVVHVLDKVPSSATQLSASVSYQDLPIFPLHCHHSRSHSVYIPSHYQDAAVFRCSNW